jgi:hypothetical protein
MYYLDGQRLNIWDSTKKRIHLGDAIAALNAGIYVAKMRKLRSIKLSIAYVSYRRGNLKFMKEMLKTIDTGDLDVEIVKSSGTEPKVTDELYLLGVPHVGLNYIYDATYCRSKIRRSSQIQKKICYCWDAIYRRGEVPKDIDLLLDVLKNEFPGYEFVKLGLPKTVNGDLLELSDCYFYIGFDSGVAHLCRLMGAPLFLLGNVGGFPEHACERKLVTWQRGQEREQEFLKEIHNYLLDFYNKVCYRISYTE